jgi:hypothetical protein
MKQILIVSCTRGPKSETKIYKSMSHFSDVKLEIVEQNNNGLPQVYNRYINNKTLKKHDIVLFVHDDVYIDDLRLRGKLYNNIRAFDIVGLAGCVKPVIKKPVLWHLMSARSNHRGVVYHPCKVTEDEYAVAATSFGYTPSRVAIIDGLFMAVNLKSVLNSQWKFNENFTFHHYDIAGCLDANNKRLKIGVAPIHVIHDSLGLNSMTDKTWTDSQNKFLELYG